MKSPFFEKQILGLEWVPLYECDDICMQCMLRLFSGRSFYRKYGNPIFPNLDDRYDRKTLIEIALDNVQLGKLW